MSDRTAYVAIVVLLVIVACLIADVLRTAPAHRYKGPGYLIQPLLIAVGVIWAVH